MLICIRTSLFLFLKAGLSLTRNFVLAIPKESAVPVVGHRDILKLFVILKLIELVSVVS